MSKSESDAQTSSSESESDEENVPMQTTDESDVSDQEESGSDADSSDVSDDSEDESEHSSSGASDSEGDVSAREAAAAVVRAIAEREAAKVKRRELNAKKKAAKAEAVAAASAASPAVTVSPAVAAAFPPTGAAPSTLLNKLIKDITPTDYYYHLGLSSAMDLKVMFGDVRFVVLSGSAVRAAETATKLQQALGIKIPTGCVLAPIGKTERYSIYKAGPVLSVSHGMGKPSISIMLHELTKMLAAAGVLDRTTYIRIGTCGGVGAEPGTVIVSSGTVNGALEPTFPVIVLGRTVQRPCRIDAALVKAIMSVPLPAGSNYKIIKGLTMATDDFYEGQGRLDGAIAEYTLQDKMDFLARAHKLGVKNIEMESDAIVAFCTKLNIRVAVVCAAIVNRLNGDQVTSTPAQQAQFTDNAVQVAIRYIHKELKNKAPKDAKDKAQTNGNANASSKKKKNKQEQQEQAAASSKKKKGGKEPNQKASQSQKKNKGPKTPSKGSAPSTPAASGKKAKGPKTPAPATPAPATPAPTSHAEKVVAAAAAVAAKEAAKALAAAQPKSSKKKKGDAAATPKKEAASTPAATPAASEKKKKKDKAAPATPAAAAAPAAPATAPLNRREKKRLAEEAAAAAKAAAESKAAADAATIAANRAADLLKFDPDAAFPKVKRPNKNERAAERQRKALEALAQTNAPAAVAAAAATNGAAFATPAKAANGAAPTASATVDGKKRKMDDEPAVANGKVAPATEAKKSKKAKKEE